MPSDTDQRAKKFHFLPHDKPFAPLKDKDIAALLQKWTMYDSMRVTRFRFDQKFQHYEFNDFLKDLFNDENVLAELQVLGDVRGHWTHLGQPGKCTEVKAEALQCKAVSMEFFDRLYECEAIRSSGSICGCVPEYVDQFTINSEVGKIMLMEDHDNYDIFTEAERNELLFKIFQHLTLGGPLNQYEDEIGPYFDTVKAFYKNLISVGKDAKSGKIHVTSVASKVDEAQGLFGLFPQKGHPQNFCYVVVNPLKREATVWYHAWCGD